MSNSTSHDAQDVASRRLAAVAAVLAALGVVSGAFAAHSLKQQISAEALAVWTTGATYHQMQSLGALLASLLSMTAARSPRLARSAALVLMLGILIFSGSLYALALGAPRAMGMITPLGGLSFIAGWILLAASMVAKAPAQE